MTMRSMNITPSDLACDWFEGTVLSYATHHRERVTRISVTSALRFAQRCGATPDEIVRRVARVEATACQPDRSRLDEIKQLTDFLPG